MFRVGQGYDIHALAKNRPLILGGVNINFTLGLLGHSDADVLLHAIIDALLGAVGLGDIGRSFPNHDPTFCNIDSRILLRLTNDKLKEYNWCVINVDATIIAESPQLSSYTDLMCENIASDLKIPSHMINIKSKTNEKFGYLGRQEAIVAQAIVLCSSLV